MANVTSIAKPATQVKSLDTGIYNIADKPVLPAANNGDRIVLFTFPHAFRMTSSHLKVPATLGAGCTIKLQKNSGGTYTDITALTTAATAGVVTSAAIGPTDFAAGDTIEVLISGANLTSGTVETDILGSRP
jgi:hypothetical protein